MVIAVACNMDRRTIIFVGVHIGQIILKNINDLSNEFLRAFLYQTCSAFTHFYSPFKSAVNSATVYEKYDYPGRYKKDEQGNPFSLYRLESELALSETANAEGDDMRVVPGYGFTLEGHANSAFNQDWLVVRVAHFGKQTGSLDEEAGEEGNRYENTLFLIPHNKPWRSPLKPRPIIRGTQVAHVTGPEGEEIYCDEWGRVKLQFPWDRLGNFDEHSSCWVRVVQGWAGAQYGNMMIPRIGHEVLVKFLNGDPDQPIVVGRTYHSTTEPPYELPKHKTRMTIKSKTHKGNGFNELRFEDEMGREEVFIHAEKDLNHIVKHDETTQVGHDRTEQVGRNETIHIGNDRMETVGQDEDLTINRDQIRSIGRNRITKIEKDDILNVNNNRRVNVHADSLIKVGQDLTIEIAQNGSWVAGELFEQVCELFDLEGYDEVHIQGPAGEIVLNQEGITLIGNVYVEGPLTEDAGAADGVSPFETTVNDSITPNTYYSTRLDVYDVYGRCNEKKVPYTILDSQGEVITDGVLDEDGRTARVYREFEEQLTVFIGKAKIES